MAEKIFSLPDQTINSVDHLLKLEKNDPYLDMLTRFETEKLPFLQTQDLTLSRLNQLTQAFRLNPIFNTGLKEAGVSEIKSWNDWQAVPTTSREHLSRFFNKTKEGFIIPWNDNGYFPIASGGTTNNPVVTFHRVSEVDNVTTVVGRYWRNYMLKRAGSLDARLISIISEAANGWATHYVIGEMCKKTGLNFVPMGPLTSEVTADIWFNSIGLTDIKGTAADFTHLTHLLSSYQFPKVKTIIYGGEYLPPSTKDNLNNVFPNAQIVGTYSSTQALGVGAQFVGETGLRILPTNHVEIIREDGSIANQGEEGNIHITRLMGLSGVLPRFNIADRGAIFYPNPDDPIQLPLLELKGRTGDIVRFGQYEINLKEFYSIINSVLKRIISEQTQSDAPDIYNLQLHMNAAAGNYSLFVSTHSGRGYQLDEISQDRLIRRAMIQSATAFSGMQAQRLNEQEINSAPIEYLLNNVENATTDLPTEMVRLSIFFVQDEKIKKTTVGKVLPVVNESI